MNIVIKSNNLSDAMFLTTLQKKLEYKAPHRISISPQNYYRFSFDIKEVGNDDTGNCYKIKNNKYNIHKIYETLNKEALKALKLQSEQFFSNKIEI
jgi:hypothetical protein